MIAPFVSVHMICKESTNLGANFLDSALTSLKNSYYPNEIIFIDNGNTLKIKEKLRDYWIKEFNSHDCELKVYESNLGNFTNLRNLCLEKTNPKTDYFHWIDSDEIYYEADLDYLKNTLLSTDLNKISQVYTYFYHYIETPFKIQCDPLRDHPDYYGVDDARITKDNVFKFNTNLKWNKSLKVHEHLTNLSEGHKVQSEVEYLHLSYTRQVWRTFIKWMFYSVLEFGNVNVYKHETIILDSNGVEVNSSFEGKEGYEKKTVEHMRSWRNPNNIVFDRLPFCKPYPNDVCPKKDLPEGFITLLNGCKTDEDWKSYINSLEDNSFWEWWQELYKEKGLWSLTLDPVVERLNREGWDKV